MKIYSIAMCIVFAAPLCGQANPFSNRSADIIESRAELVLGGIKKIDKAALEVGAELAQKVLKERSQRARTIEDWIWGAVGLAGLLWVFYEKEPSYKYVAPIIFGNIFYAYWWKGPQNRLNRAQIIADAFDREMGITRDGKDEPLDGK